LNQRKESKKEEKERKKDEKGREGRKEGVAVQCKEGGQAIIQSAIRTVLSVTLTSGRQQRQFQSIH
jgi:hypothetical protein